MASKNLGAVIQRAISDGAFRRQLQSDPAAALRGFNLSPDEIAAVRSGDSSKLMSLGVDQRMSKAFGISGAATKNATTGDITASTSNSIVGTDGGSLREGIVGDQTSGARAAYTTGTESGVRATVTAPEDSYRTINDPENSGATRETINDATVAGTRSASSTGTQDSYRPINDPDNSGATRETVSSGTQDSYRAINDPDNTGTTRETVSSGTQDSYRAINDPDNAGTTTGSASSAIEDPNSPEYAAAQADDNTSVASRMADANVDLSGSDVQRDLGDVDTHSAFNPSDSADVQRELLDSTHSGDAIGNTENPGDTGDEHSWGA